MKTELEELEEKINELDFFIENLKCGSDNYRRRDKLLELRMLCKELAAKITVVVLRGKSPPGPPEPPKKRLVKEGLQLPKKNN